MTLDRLLLWLSAKGQGYWSQFRAAVEEFCADESDSLPGGADDPEREDPASSDVPIYQQARFALQRLGHVEFYATGAENGWRVVPPSVAFPTDTSNSGVLCGARSPTILENLSQLDDTDVIASEFEGMPRLLLLRATSQDTVVGRAKELGFQIQKNAPIAILSVIPRVRDMRSWHGAPMPETPGWSVHRFSASRQKWLGVLSRDAASARTGLFRFVLRHQRLYYLRWGNCSYRVPVQVGKYAIMRGRRGIITYDSGQHTFSTLAIFRPPLLIERALVLCSGKLGHFDPATSRIEYNDVTPSVASLAAQLLQQEIR